MLLGGGDLWIRRPEFQSLGDLIGGRGWLLGMPFFFGIAGLYAMATGWRNLRAASSILSAIYWWNLTGYFVGRELVSLSAMYGCAALSEMWVFVRVRYRFDTMTRRPLSGLRHG